MPDLKMKLKLGLVAIILVSAYVGIAYVLSDAGQQYQESRQTLQEGLESNTPTATDELPSKDKLYVVYFTADWCSPCIQMKPHWKHKTVQDQLKKYRGTKSGTIWKPHKIDTDLKKNQSILKKYKVSGIPCIILMDNGGKEWGRVVGYRTQSQLRSFLSKGAVWPKTKQ